MDLSYELLLIAPLVVFSAYVIYGASGFGSALINVSVLAHFLPLTIVVPLSLLLDFSAAMLVGMRFRAGVQWHELSLLALFGLVGTVAGVVLLISLPRDYALIALGVLIVAYGTYSLSRPDHFSSINRLWAVPAGLFGGALGGLFGTGGPVFVIYLSRRISDVMQLKASLAGLFAFQNATRIVAYLISGLLLQWHVLLAALALFPVMWLGVRVGNRLHSALPRARVIQLISAVLIATGATLVMRVI